MLWIIALLIAGIIGIILFRFYYNPPISHIAKQQRKNYLRRFQFGKTLIYQMTENQVIQLREQLNKYYLNAGSGCYYGNRVMIYLEVSTPQVTISLFNPTEDDLVRHTYKLMQIKNKLGGKSYGSTNG